MNLNVRLNILKDAGQISEDTYEKILNTIKMFDEDWSIKLTEENGSMLVTHLSVAIERIMKNETVEGVNKDIFTEILNNRYYDKGKKILNNIQEIIKVEFPENEQGFIMMHLCVLLETEGKRGE